MQERGWREPLQTQKQKSICTITQRQVKSYRFPTPKSGDFYNAMSSVAGAPTLDNSGGVGDVNHENISLGKKLTNILEKIVGGGGVKDPSTTLQVTPSLKSALQGRSKVYGLLSPSD